MTSTVDQSDTSTRKHPSLSMKAVRLDVNTDDQHRRPHSRPRKLLSKEPTPMPRRVYGFYVPDDTCVMLGLRMSPDIYPPVLSDNDRARLLFLGIKCANRYCTEMFPHIPLRWVSCVYVICEKGMQPLLVLGHRYPSGPEKIYVTDEQAEELRADLQLGNQQPGWYTIKHVYGRW